MLAAMAIQLIDFVGTWQYRAFPSGLTSRRSCIREARRYGLPPVPALNNLALALDAQGQTARRMEVAGRVVRFGGPFIAQVRNTLATLVE